LVLFPGKLVIKICFHFPSVYKYNNQFAVDHLKIDQLAKINKKWIFIFAAPEREQYKLIFLINNNRLHPVYIMYQFNVLPFHFNIYLIKVYKCLISLFL